MRSLCKVLMLLACTGLPVVAKSYSENKYLHVVEVVREKVDVAPLSFEHRETLENLLNEIEEAVELRTGDAALTELVLAVLAICEKILIDVQDLPFLIDVQILDTQDSLSFTIVDEANRIISAIDNISIVFTGTVTINNAPVLAALVDMQASLGFTIVDRVDNAVQSLGFTIVDYASSIIDQVNLVNLYLTGTISNQLNQISTMITTQTVVVNFAPVEFTIVDQVTNAQASLGFTIVDRVDNARQSLGFTIVDYASSIIDQVNLVNLYLTGTISNQLNQISTMITTATVVVNFAPVEFTIVDQVTNAQASLGFTIVDRVDNARQSLGFTIVDYASSIIDQVNLVNLYLTGTISNQLNQISTMITTQTVLVNFAPVEFTIVDQVTNAQASLGFTIVDYASSIIDQVNLVNLYLTGTISNQLNQISTMITTQTVLVNFAPVEFTIVDQVTNAQASLGFTIVDGLAAVNTNLSTKLDSISTQIGALDGSLVELIVFEMLTAVETFTTLASITDHVLMTLTAIDVLSQQVMANYQSMVELVAEAVQSVGFTIVDQVTNAQMSLGFTIIDRITDSQVSLGFTIVDQVTNAQASLGFTIVDQVESVVSLIDFTILCDPTPIRQSDVTSAGGLLRLTTDLSSVIKNYCLTQNITGTLSIVSDDIFVDLNERALTGLISIAANRVTVSNGTVIAPAPISAGDAALAAIRINSGADQAIVDDCRVLCTATAGAFDGRSGISNAGTNAIIRNCVVQSGSAGSGNGGHGILVASPASKTHIENCLIEQTGSGAGTDASGGDGIRLSSGSSNTIARNNTIANSGANTGTGLAGMAIRDLSGVASANTATSKVYSNFAYDIANTATIYSIENEGAFVTDNGVDVIAGTPGQFSNVYVPNTN